MSAIPHEPRYTNISIGKFTDEKVNAAVAAAENVKVLFLFCMDEDR